MTFQQFTFHGNPAAEKTLSGALAAISGEIASCPDAASIEAVLLGGGYGRGEGGAKTDGSLYNDLDFFVLVNDSANGPELRKFFDSLSGEWTSRLKLSVDFTPPQKLSHYCKNFETLMIQELLAGHFTVFGSDSALDSVPRLPWKEIPFSEGGRLLLNRGAGIYLSMLRFQKPLSPEDADFVRRNLGKAVLGCGDAILIGRHLYRRAGMKRAEELSRLSGLPEGLMNLYSHALEEKYTPPLSFDSSGLVGRCEEVTRLWKESLSVFTQDATGTHGRTALENAELLARRPEFLSFSKTWKAILLNLCYCRSLPSVFPLRTHPRRKVLINLAEALDSPYDSSVSKSFLTLWNRFN